MTIRNAVLATLAYHDIFDYPLAKEEIHKFLVGSGSDTKKIEKSLQALVKDKKISQTKDLFFLRGRNKIVKLRQSRGAYSKVKLERARFFSNLLAAVPTVQMVAVSGALAMGNAQKNDDIDLVIVTAKNTLWSTRLLANTILQPFRRKAGRPHTKDKACLNLFIEESSLKIRTQNLYSAHEVAQMRPLWQRRNTYNRFLKANSWVKNYLPNWTPNVEGLMTKAGSKNRESLVVSRLALVAEPLEALAKWGQLKYMKKKITTEKIGKHQLFFHPKDTESWVLKTYIKKLSKFTLGPQS